MKDRRSVDDLSIEELERILLMKKREARLARLRRQHPSEWDVTRDPLAPDPPEPEPFLPVEHREHDGEGATATYRTVELPPRPPLWRRLLRLGPRPEEPSPSPWAQQEPPPPWHRRVRWRWVRDTFLLILEVAALVGLILVLLESLINLRMLNEEAARVQAQQLQPLPTPSPTPLIDVVLLPSGHSPPTSPQGAQPEKVPEHLRPLVQQITPRPVPTPGPEQATRIVIPAIGVDAPVVEGDDWEALKRGAGHHIGSANPGEAGNVVISAHNDIFGEIFRRLPELELDDEVYVYTATRAYRYVVRAKRIVDPTEVSVMYPTRDPILTLISCYPYRVNTHRIVVIAELASNP